MKSITYHRGSYCNRDGKFNLSKKKKKQRCHRLILQPVTYHQSSLGRAFSSSSIQIWDSKTSSVASFATSFTFNIFAPNKSNSANAHPPPPPDSVLRKRPLPPDPTLSIHLRLQIQRHERDLRLQIQHDSRIDGGL